MHVLRGASWRKDDSDLVEDDIVGVVIKLRGGVAGFRLDNKPRCEEDGPDAL